MKITTKSELNYIIEIDFFVADALKRSELNSRFEIFYKNLPRKPNVLQTLGS